MCRQYQVRVSADANKWLFWVFVCCMAYSAREKSQWKAWNMSVIIFKAKSHLKKLFQSYLHFHLNIKMFTFSHHGLWGMNIQLEFRQNIHWKLDVIIVRWYHFPSNFIPMITRVKICCQMHSVLKLQSTSRPSNKPVIMIFMTLEYGSKSIYKITLPAVMARPAGRGS